MSIWGVVRKILAAAAIALGTGSASGGVIWAEVGDAGELPATAATSLVQETLDAIEGALNADDTLGSGVDYVDTFRLFIGSPETFSASTGDGSDLSLIADPVLYLFDSAGVGVVMDDESGGFGQAAIGALPSGFGAGYYYLAIAFAGVTPIDAGGFDIFDAFGSLAVLSTDPVAAFVGAPLTPDTAISGLYSIAITGASAAPEPGTLVLLAVALLSFAVAARARSRG